MFIEDRVESNHVPFSNTLNSGSGERGWYRNMNVFIIFVSNLILNQTPFATNAPNRGESIFIFPTLLALE